MANYRGTIIVSVAAFLIALGVLITFRSLFGKSHIIDMTSSVDSGVAARTRVISDRPPGMIPASQNSSSPNNVPIPPAGRSSLHISIADAELLVTDPNGLKSGFDVTTLQNVNQIPGSAYSSEGLANDETGAPPTQIDYYLDIRQPTAGIYTVSVQGLKLETSTLSIRVFDANGTAEPPLSVPVIIASGSSGTLNVQFSSLPGTSSTVAVEATFQSTLADIQNSLQLGLIDNAGVAESLLQKIQAAEVASGPTRDNTLNAFIDQVTASGRHITDPASEVLLQDGNALLHQGP